MTPEQYASLAGYFRMIVDPFAVQSVVKWLGWLLAMVGGF